MRTSIGGYTPLRIDAAVINAAPKTIQDTWKTVTAAQKRYLDARDVLAVMQQQAKEAPAADAQAAQEAVAAGKPIPAPTVNGIQQSIDQQEREIRALADHCDSIEWGFLAQLYASKTGMIDGFRSQSVTSLTDAINAVTAAQEALERFTMSASLWQWARDEDDRVPPRHGFQIPVHGGGTVDALLQRVIETMHREHPDDVEAKEAAYKAEVAALTRHSTPDGLVIDAAAISHYSH